LPSAGRQGTRRGNVWSSGSLLPRQGWVVFGGFSRGFIATTAYDGAQVFGATALGDFGRFETNGSQGPRGDGGLSPGETAG